MSYEMNDYEEFMHDIQSRINVQKSLKETIHLAYLNDYSGLAIELEKIYNEFTRANLASEKKYLEQLHASEESNLSEN